MAEQLLFSGLNQAVEKPQEQLALGEALEIEGFIGVGRIECDPEEDEPGILVVRLLFRPVQPTEGAVHSKGEGAGKSFADFSLSCF